MRKQDKEGMSSTSSDHNPTSATSSSSSATTSTHQTPSKSLPPVISTSSSSSSGTTPVPSYCVTTDSNNSKPQSHPSSATSSTLSNITDSCTRGPPAPATASSSKTSVTSSTGGAKSCEGGSNKGVAAMGMKHSKSDHTSLGRKEKSSSKDRKTAMGKKFISKSQENLANGKKGTTSNNKQQQQQQHSQMTMVVEPSPRARPNALVSAARAEAASDRNKENQALKERGKNTTSDSAIFAKPKPVKPSSDKNGGLGMTGNLRKASSTQSINKSGGGSLGGGSIKSNSSSKSSMNVVAIKRAQSTQNISKDKFTKKRTSAPADVMAYNAELLANFEKEKKLLEVRISELTKVAEGRKVEIEKYKYEVKRLKNQISTNVSDKEQVEVLKNQNKQLNDRLQELGYPAEQVTDTEKLLLKSSSAWKNQGSASDTCLPASASCDSLSTDGGGSKDLHRSNSLSASEPGLLLEDYCGTPDHPSVLSLDNASSHWEKQSNKSANSDGGNSEVSVACLTERILQMEETNYSTTEELQATLQELGDLQDAVNELTEENGRLVNEKTVLLESLCAQTEKLEKTRIQLEQLKCLLISGELPDKSEMDGHLRGLLKSAQEEREELMRKQIEWSNALEGLENECKETQEAGEALREKYSLLEATNKSLKADRDATESQLSQTKEELVAERIEVVRLKTLLETERKKVLELETARMAQDKTDVETLLDTARRDKAEVEQKLADSVERLAKSQCEVTRVKDVLSTKDQELIVWRNNSYEERGKLQYELEESKNEGLALVTEIDKMRSHMVELEAECDRMGVEKKSLSNKFQELQTELKNTMQQNLVLDAEMQEMRCKHDTESEEWRQFQKDLQTAVVIANNFSQETQKSMETLNDEKTVLQDQVSNLQCEVERLKEDLKVAQESVTTTESPSRKYPILTNAELKGKVLNSVDRDLVVLRDRGRGPTTSQLDQRSQSISVKSLIRSIEEQVKSGCSSMGQSSHSESRRSSNSSDISLSSLKELVNSPLVTPESPNSPSKEFAFRAASLRVSTPASGSTKPPRDRSPQGGTSTTTPPLCPNASLGQGQGDLPSRSSGSSSGGAAGGAGGIFSTPTRIDGSGGDLSGSGKVSYPITSILKDRSTPRRNSSAIDVDSSKKETPGKDPLASLAKVMKGSKRNALLKWCQMKTIQYSNVDITNFSSSWNDGLAFCALIHCYVPQKIPYAELNSEDKMRNFSLAFKVGESIGIKSNLNINDMVCMERPDWQAVMGYVTSIYKHFEVDRQ